MCSTCTLYDDVLQYMYTVHCGINVQALKVHCIYIVLITVAKPFSVCASSVYVIHRHLGLFGFTLNYSLVLNTCVHVERLRFFLILSVSASIELYMFDPSTSVLKPVSGFFTVCACTLFIITRIIITGLC